MVRLSYNSLYTWGLKKGSAQRYFFTLAASLIFLLVWYTVVFSPLQAHVTKQHRLQDQQVAAACSAYEMRYKNAQLGKEYNVQRSAISALVYEDGNDLFQSGILPYLNNSITLKSYTPHQRIDKDIYSKERGTIRFETDINGLYVFMNNIAATQKLIRCAECSLAEVAAGRYECTCVIERFVSKKITK